MAPENKINDFLSSLLTLQQDGKQAISAPANWTIEEPLLYVSTDLDEIVADIQDTLLMGEAPNDTARWHFFIGSPGNGKSASIGKLCRHLFSDKNCTILDECRCPIQELQPTDVPYALDVYEEGNKFASVRIVQDASVVRNPFSPDADPAKELIATLEEAWDRGISLIVCSNRGIMEKAYRDNIKNEQVSPQPWFRALSQLVQSKLTLDGEIEEQLKFVSRRPVFNQVKVTFSHLDIRSLLLGSDIFDRILQKAVNPRNWESCEECSAGSLCPYKANRDWLDDDEGRKIVIQVLQSAEVFSGQIIVFREALALVSLLLAGCARDYTNIQPCEWVRAKASSEDFFSLAARRIHMSLFASYVPHGLEINSTLHKTQVDALHLVQKSLERTAPNFKKSVDFVVAHPSPSTDVGITRLLGENGIFALIDPCRESLPAEFYDTWDSDLSAVEKVDSRFLAPIDRKCLEIWVAIEQVIESTPDYTALNSHWALRRWSSNYLMHLGCLIEGRTLWRRELQAYIKILEATGHAPATRTVEEKRLIRDFENNLEALLDTGSSQQKSSEKISLSEAVELQGLWVTRALKPKIVANERTSSVSLYLQFGGGEHASLGASMYAWLSLRARGNLDPRCFPHDLLTAAMDARIRAAARGKYAYENDDVELRVQAGEDEIFRLVRLEGDVDIKHG